MNVFVLSTGRCGSMTFARACGHFTNYTSGHETRGGRLGDDRLAYPKDHIESDNRLSWFLGRLDEAYGDDAFYVHLTRDPQRVAESFNKKWSAYRGIISAYDRGIAERGDREFEVCLDYVRTVNENISLFIRHKPNTMAVELETASSTFPEFIDRIGAEGDLDAAVGEFSRTHNASRSPEPDLRLRRRLAKVKRAVRGAPAYLRGC